MALSPGTRLGSYEILAALGSGGMGDVYRARDARLNRDVAIKVLPDRLVHDPVSLARFEREAQAVAALSHPNILAIYDFAHDSGGAYAVTELLDGHTLRSRLADGAIPARKAVEIATGVARGIAAAHERGIIHRDLKPENIFLTTHGVVKILDFGLARPVEGNASNTVQASSETRLSLTGEGTVLGTAGYMAPEQVRGQTLDARTDLFALGIVLHEMLTGTRPFQRDTAAETMTAILKDDPPDVPASRAVSPALERIVRHCLEKLPAERFQTARDVAFALEALSGSQSAPAIAAGGGGADVIVASPVPDAKSVWRERALWGAATTIATAAAAWFALVPLDRVPADETVVRTNIQIPGNYIFRAGTPPARRLAVSPDDRHIAFAIAGRGAAETELFIYSFETGSLVAVPDSRSATAPFWSPDGNTLAFLQGNRVMTVDTAGGRPTTRAVAIGGTGDLNRNGDIVSLDASGKFLAVLARGSSEWRKIEGPGSGPERYATYPVWLPDGQRFIFGFGGPDAPSKLNLGDIGGSAWKPVLPLNLDRESSNVMYVSGYLIGMRDRMIVARQFNPDAPDESVEPVVLGGPVDSSTRGSAAFSISANLLAYQPVASEAATRLQWYDVNGTKLTQLADDTGYSNPELSPDGSQLLVGILDPAAHTRDIWVVDVNRGVRTRLTSDPNVDERSAVWGTDSTWFVYRGANRDLYRRPIGSGTPEPLIVDGRSKDPRMFTKDGKYFLYRVSGDGTSNDIWVKPINPDGPPRPLIATAFNESYADVSPDGRWLVYVSDESQQPAVFLTSFPNGTGKWRVSPAGGNVPRWSHDGRELYFLDDDRVLMRASVTATGDTIQVGAATPLFQTAADRGPGPQFVVTNDGKRVLVNTEIATGAPEVLSVVTNWQALLRRKQ